MTRGWKAMVFLKPEPSLASRGILCDRLGDAGLSWAISLLAFGELLAMAGGERCPARPVAKSAGS